jgi:hypothetical protein
LFQYSHRFTGRNLGLAQRRTRSDLQSRVLPLLRPNHRLPVANFLPERLTTTQQRTILLDYRRDIMLPSQDRHTIPCPLSIPLHIRLPLPIVLSLNIIIHNFFTPLFRVKFNLLLPGFLLNPASPTRDQEILRTTPLAAATTTPQGRTIE